MTGRSCKETSHYLSGIVDCVRITGKSKVTHSYTVWTGEKNMLHVVRRG